MEKVRKSEKSESPEEKFFKFGSSGLSNFRSSGLPDFRTIFALHMKKIYHLGNCTTCQAIIKETGIDEKGFAMQDIETEAITPVQLDEMKKMTGSYEALFSRRAMKYKEMGLKDKSLSEKDYRQLILDEYTFLKRPVVIINNTIFTGSEKKTVEALKKAVK
jgi:arsenate reductase